MILVASGGGEVRRWDEGRLPLSPPVPVPIVPPSEPGVEAETETASVAPSTESCSPGDDADEGGASGRTTTTMCHHQSGRVGQGGVVGGAAAPPGPSREDGPDAVIAEVSSSALGGNEVRHYPKEKHGGDDDGEDDEDRPPEPRRIVPVPIDLSAHARFSPVGRTSPRPPTPAWAGHPGDDHRPRFAHADNDESIGESLPPQPRRYADHVPAPSSPPPRPRPMPPQPHPHPTAEVHRSNGPPRTLLTNTGAAVGVGEAAPPTSTDGSTSPTKRMMQGRPIREYGGISEQHRHRRDDNGVSHDERTAEGGDTGRRRPPLSAEEDGRNIYEEYRYVAPHPRSAPVLNSSLHEYEYHRHRLEQETVRTAGAAHHLSRNATADVDNQYDHSGRDSRQQDHHTGVGKARVYNNDSSSEQREEGVGRRRRAAAAAANEAVNVPKTAILYPDLVPLDEGGEGGRKKVDSQSKRKVKKGVSEEYLKILEATAPTLEDLWPDDAEPVVEMPPPPDINDSFFERLGQKIRNEAGLAHYLYPGELSGRVDPY